MRILYYGDFDCATGFAKVSKNLIDRWIEKLGDKDELVILALNNFQEEAYEYGDNAIVIPLLGTREKNDADPHCRNSFLRFLYSGDFDHVFILNDLEVVSPLKKHILDIKKKKQKNKKPKFKLHLYYPVDSEPAKKYLDILEIVSHAYPYTNYAKALTEKHCDPKKIQVVPHGIEHDVFKPLDEVETIFPPDAYVFGSVNRNSQRKDVATLLQAFALLKNQLYDSDADLILYLHMNPMDSFGLRIVQACDVLGLEVGKDVWLPENFNENKGFEPEKMNELYNMFDVFVTTTTAEGWGLTICEAMACEVPVIAPIHTSIREITENGTLIYPLRDLTPFMFVKDMEKVRYISNVKEVAKRMLDSLAEINSPYQDDLTAKARKKVLEFDWDKSASLIFKNFK